MNDNIDPIAFLVFRLISTQRQMATVVREVERGEVGSHCLLAGLEIQEAKLIVNLLVATTKAASRSSSMTCLLSTQPNDCPTTEHRP